MFSAAVRELGVSGDAPESAGGAMGNLLDELREEFPRGFINAGYLNELHGWKQARVGECVVTFGVSDVREVSAERGAAVYGADRTGGTGGADHSAVALVVRLRISVLDGVADGTPSRDDLRALSDAESPVVLDAGMYGDVQDRFVASLWRTFRGEFAAQRERCVVRR